MHEPSTHLHTLEKVENRIVQMMATRPRRALVRDARPAAALLLIFPGQSGPATLLTKRAAHLPHHPGQISLPGGAMDPEDADLTETALRETHEEVGIPPENVRVLGMLDDVHVWVSGFVMTPVVGVTDREPDVTANPYEIDRVLSVPLAEVVRLDQAIPADAGRLELRYPLDGEDVWGATAVVLRSFVRLLSE